MVDVTRVYTEHCAVSSGGMFVHIRFAGTNGSQDDIIRCRFEAARQSACLEVASSRWIFTLSYAVKSYQRCLADLSFALSIVNEATLSQTGS